MQDSKGDSRGKSAEQMADLTGEVVEGKVIKLLNRGALIELPESKTGFLHISEISHRFVKDISDHLREGDTIKVKVLGFNERGRYEVSMKQAQPRQDPPPADDHPRTFEDKLSKFMKESEERLVDLKKNIESKRSGGRKK